MAFYLLRQHVWLVFMIFRNTSFVPDSVVADATLLLSFPALYFSGITSIGLYTIAAGSDVPEECI